MLNKISASLLLLLLGRKEGRRPKAEQRRSLSLSRIRRRIRTSFATTSRGIENTKVCFTREGDECVRAFGILKETRGRKEEKSGEIKKNFFA